MSTAVLQQTLIDKIALVFGNDELMKKVIRSIDRLLLVEEKAKSLDHATMEAIAKGQKEYAEGKTHSFGSKEDALKFFE